MIVGIFIVAAVATPPDVVSQLILAIPLMLLFEGSLLLMRLGEQGATARREAAAEAEAEGRAAKRPATEAVPAPRRA